MGAKADKIQKELDKTNDELNTARTELLEERAARQQLERTIQALKPATGEMGLSRRRAAPSHRAEAAAFPGGSFADEALDEADEMLDEADNHAAAARALQITPAQAQDLAMGRSLLSDHDRKALSQIAAALGLPADTDDLLAIQRSLDGLHRGTVDRAFVKDNLADAITHNRAERQQLLDDLTMTRAIVSRVAAALQVGDWNKQTGDEIVERAQRYEGLAHWIRKRIRELDALPGGRPERVSELHTILTRLVAPKQLDAWLAKQPSSFAPTDELVQLAKDEAANPRPRATFTRDTVVRTVLRWGANANGHEDRGTVGGSDDEVRAFFEVLEKIPTLEAQFTEFVNVVLAPQVAKFIEQRKPWWSARSGLDPCDGDHPDPECKSDACFRKAR